jgi:hypothetical protein
MTVPVRPLSSGKCLALLTFAVLGLSACGSSGNTASTSASSAPSDSPSSAPATAASSPAAGAAADLSKLVIQPGDIPIPGFAQKSSQPVSQGGANGIAVLFANAEDTREVGDTIVLLPDAPAAATAAKAAVSASQAQFAGATAAPAQVGDGATVLSGTQNGKATTVLIFQEGKAFVVMQFDSAENDPVPADLVTSVGQKQDQLIKTGLTG